MADKGIPSWPKVTIRLYDDHNGEVKIAGRSHPVNAADPREAALAIVADRAAQLGRPVKATAVEPDGEAWPLVIHPDGNVEAIAVTSPGKPMWPIFAATGVAVVLVAATLGYLLVRDPGPTRPKSTASPTLPALPAPRIVPEVFDARPIPPGWSNTADWTIDVAPDTVPAVSGDGKLVALIHPDRRIVMLDPAGKVLWQDEVDRDTKSPVFTTIDDKPVVAVVSPKELVYWPRVGAGLPTAIELPSGTNVQFFGPSPLFVGEDGTARVVTGGELKPIDRNALPRRASALLADGSRVLLAAYYGPWWFAEPGKPLVEVQPKAPAGATRIDHVVAASPGRVLALWQTKTPGQVVPAVHNAQDGAAVAICPTADPSTAQGWHWVPDGQDNVAAWGECVISYRSSKVYRVSKLEPLSATDGKIYGRIETDGAVVTPGRPPKLQSPDTARPWGVAGTRAIVVHESVLYALAPEGG